MALGLKEGDAIADIGAGTGYFAFRFAHDVGATGQVYAVDVSPDMILHMNRQIRDLGLGNVRTILAPPDDPLLADHWSIASSSASPGTTSPTTSSTCPR